MENGSAKGIQSILASLPSMEKEIRKAGELLLANLIMIGEIPAPTFGEAERMRFLVNRFAESDLQNCSTDEAGNALGIIPGSPGEANLLVTAHLDTVFDEKVDHTIFIQPDSVTGPGVGGNAIGLAAMATIPLLLDMLKIKLRSNLVLMGSARTLDRGDLEGLRFFLDNTSHPISAGVSVEGTMLGTLSYSSIGMMSCAITFHVPEEYDWSKFEAMGAVSVMNELINRILEIPLPRKPRSGIVLGSIEGGTSYGVRATRALLRIQIRSESWEKVQELLHALEEIVEEVSSNTGYEGRIAVAAKRKPGGIPFSHPLVDCARQILESLSIKPRITPNTGGLSAFFSRGIPAVSIGLTTGENAAEENESIDIEPIYTGMTQLLGLVLALDKGYCGVVE